MAHWLPTVRGLRYAGSVTGARPLCVSHSINLDYLAENQGFEPRMGSGPSFRFTGLLGGVTTCLSLLNFLCTPRALQLHMVRLAGRPLQARQSRLVVVKLDC